MKAAWLLAASAMFCSIPAQAEDPAETKKATPKPPPRRSVEAIIAGATGLSAGLTMVAVSAIVAVTQPCVTFPSVPSGCDPPDVFDNTYAAPLLLTGGIVAVLSIPVLSIGLERDTGPLETSAIPRLHVGATAASLVWPL